MGVFGDIGQRFLENAEQRQRNLFVDNNAVVIIFDATDDPGTLAEILGLTFNGIP